MLRAGLCAPAVLTAVVCAMLVTGCPTGFSGESGGGPPGSVRLMVTDKPYPVALIERAEVTVTRIDVRRAGADDELDDDAESGDDDSTAPEKDDPGATGAGSQGGSAGQDDADDDAVTGDADDDSDGDDKSNASGGRPFVTIFSGERRINLLDLRNGRMDLLADAEVPSGRYSQMRIYVTEGLVRLVDGREFVLRVPSGEQSGIKLHLAFEVEPDNETLLLLDVDLSRAFQPIPAGRISDPATIREFKFAPSIAMRLIRLLEAGSISGRVITAGAAPLEHASVTAYDEAGAEVSGSSTEADGTYKLVGLPTGRYRLVFTALGHADAELAGVEVVAGRETTGVDVALDGAPE
ncbi:MAG: DUF4382 domain-containing protein [Phycisphaerae bacterium]|nr:DUF4382 domain-containing protein [Phycisphaerae bacterium]MCZ2400989.1 DUF4382 domain-containing protein [Phycisphaerae bacterium]